MPSIKQQSSSRNLPQLVRVRCNLRILLAKTWIFLVWSSIMLLQLYCLEFENSLSTHLFEEKNWPKIAYENRTGNSEGKLHITRLVFTDTIVAKRLGCCDCLRKTASRGVFSFEMQAVHGRRPPSHLLVAAFGQYGKNATNGCLMSFLSPFLCVCVTDKSNWPVVPY